MSIELMPRPAQEAAEVNDNYVSPSRLNLWIRCPLAYKLHYIEGIPTPTTPSLFLGRVVHWMLEVFYRHRQLGVWLVQYLRGGLCA
jgi:hypothetical protein